MARSGGKPSPMPGLSPPNILATLFQRGAGCALWRAGFTFPFVQDKLSGKVPGLRIVAVEPTACPSLTKGRYLYDFGDTAGTTPLIKMYTLGHSFIPAPIHAGGLRYHADAPLLCQLYHDRLIDAK